MRHGVGPAPNMPSEFETEQWWFDVRPKGGGKETATPDRRALFVRVPSQAAHPMQRRTDHTCNCVTVDLSEVETFGWGMEKKFTTTLVPNVEAGAVAVSPETQEMLVMLGDHCTCKPSTGCVTKCRPTAKAEGQRANGEERQRICRRLHFVPDVVPAHTQVRRADLFPRRCAQHAGMSWEALWPCLSPVDVTRVHVSAKEFNDAKKYGPHAEVHFFSLRSIRETEHVRRNGPPFPSLGWKTCVLPAGPGREHSKGFLGLVSGPSGPEAGTASFARAGPARTETFFSCMTCMLDGPLFWRCLIITKALGFRV